VLAGVLPPLLYSSAVNLPVIDVRRNLSLITWLSVVLVVVSALVIGVVVHWLVPAIPFALATALGAVVSPTDAVAATAIGRGSASRRGSWPCSRERAWSTTRRRWSCCAPPSPGSR
jgi:NhaP-type Na+/H+ or K+/H+ antiporter